MNYQSLAFFTGLFGSLHCVVMCGPLVMAIPFQGKPWYGFIQKLVYQFGRILTYAILGIIAGSVGSIFNILGLQQALSLVTGILLIAIAFFHFSGKRMAWFNRAQQKLFTPVASFLGKWMSRPYGGLFAGALHGLIPCGMVYMAIAGSLSTGSALTGGAFMFYFGLGTTPLLLLTSLIPLLMRKIRVPRMVLPTLFLIAGMFLVFRSLNLDLPHINSAVNLTEEAAICE